MVVYNERELAIIAEFNAFIPRSDSRMSKYEQYLLTIPKEQKRYKCYDCFLILNHNELIDGKCPECKSKVMLEECCSIDHNGCSHPITSGITYCPICEEPVCPICGDHNVSIVSRVTGYLSEVGGKKGGWNNAKKQELKDRTRYTMNQQDEMVLVSNS